jgi:DNA-binding NtrC family response regulator
MANAAKKTTILVVDDAADTLEMLQRKLASEGYTVLAAADGARAVKVLEERRVELVITDLKMPGVNGLELVRYVRENFKNTKVMMVTGYPSIESAVGAVKSGAEEYLAKPFTDDELFAAVRRALEKLPGRGAEAGRAGRATAARFGIIGESEPTRKLIEDIDKTASTSAAVLITGESGTGKELVARAIHYQSARAAAPFVPVNCGAIPERLLESELFGYVRGAFTGAAETRAGFFQTAAGGTIFLDEISEMSPAMQVKLLRVLDTKQVYMVGSRRPDVLDVRLVARLSRRPLLQVERHNRRSSAAKAQAGRRRAARALFRRQVCAGIGQAGPRIRGGGPRGLQELLLARQR